MVAGTVSILPYRAALVVGWLNAWMAFHVRRFRVAEAKKRIRKVFGEELFSPADVDAIAWQSWRNIVFDAVELMCVGRITRAWIDRVIDSAEGLLKLKAHADTGRGAIIACSHMGNWELAAVACHHYGIPIFTLAAQQKNPLADRYINTLRRKPGIVTVARGSGAMKEVIRRLKQGQFLAILPDVRVRTGGIAVPFLGGEANVGTGMALFARHTDVPVFPSFTSRIGWARHRMEAGDALWPDADRPKADDVRRMTENVLHQIEDRIRIDPGQWFWFNKRWVLDPVE